jgi:hypothetical protein
VLLHSKMHEHFWWALIVGHFERRSGTPRFTNLARHLGFHPLLGRTAVGQNNPLPNCCSSSAIDSTTSEWSLWRWWICLDSGVPPDSWCSTAHKQTLYSDITTLSHNWYSKRLVHRIAMWNDRRGAFFFDQRYLFLNNIYYLPPDVEREHLTTFAVKQDIFMAFFHPNWFYDLLPFKLRMLLRETMLAKPRER